MPSYQCAASGSCPTLVSQSGSSLSIAIYSIWKSPNPSAWVEQLIFCCNLQHPGPDPGIRVSIVIHSMWELRDPGIRVGQFGNSLSQAICSILELPNPGTRVGQLIFYCNLQHLLVARPWRQVRAIHFLLQFLASGSCPTLVPASGNVFSIAISSIWHLGVARHWRQWRQGQAIHFPSQFEIRGVSHNLESN